MINTNYKRDKSTRAKTITRGGDKVEAADSPCKKILDAWPGLLLVDVAEAAALAE